jgi:hypothetical protein
MIMIMTKVNCPLSELYLIFAARDQSTKPIPRTVITTTIAVPALLSMEERDMCGGVSGGEGVFSCGTSVRKL